MRLNDYRNVYVVHPIKSTLAASTTRISKHYMSDDDHLPAILVKTTLGESSDRKFLFFFAGSSDANNRWKSEIG